MLKKFLFILLICTMAFTVAACAPKPEAPPAPPVENPDVVQKEKIINDAKALMTANEEPEKMVALIKANIEKAGTDGAEVMLSGLEQLQESHLAEYTDLLLMEDNQKGLLEIQSDINDPKSYENVGNKELSALLGKLRNSGYRFENFEGSWYPIVDYASYKAYSQYVTQEMKDYIELMAMESDEVSMKDAAIAINLDQLSDRLVLAENYIAKYPASPRIGRVKEAYAGYLWNLLGGSNNTPIYDWETKAIRQEVRDTYEKFSKENPDLVSTKAVRNWLEVLREGDFVFDENTMFQSLDNIYGETLKNLGIEADYK